MFTNASVGRVLITPEGYDARGKCKECGYACDSAHLLSDVPDDLKCEYILLENESLQV